MAHDGITPEPRFETDEDLKRRYGERARISRLGRYTLIHLDSPPEAEIAKRVAEFDPANFFYDDCPLCALAMSEGGHVVYDGEKTYDFPPAGDLLTAERHRNDPLRQNYRIVSANQEPPNAAARFDATLLDLARAADDFGELLTPAVPESLSDRYFQDVSDLYERMIEVLWAEEGTRRLEVFEDLVGRAHKAVDEVCAAAPHLESKSAAVRNAIDALAEVWRSL
jgi:hypothetical protein